MTDTDVVLKQRLMDCVNTRPYSFGQLKRLEMFQGYKGYEIGLALRDHVKAGRMRIVQYGNSVYFNVPSGFGNYLNAKLDGLAKSLFDRFIYPRKKWIPAGTARLEQVWPGWSVSADHAKNTVERSHSSWTLQRYAAHEEMVASGKRRNGEIDLTLNVYNSPKIDRVVLEGIFHREQGQPVRVSFGSQEKYLYPIFGKMIGGVEFKTENLTSYGFTTDFATDGNESKNTKILEFLREYNQGRYPWGFKSMLEQWVREFFANKRIGTTPRALRLKSRGYKKHQQHIDFMEYVIEKNKDRLDAQLS